MTTTAKSAAKAQVNAQPKGTVLTVTKSDVSPKVEPTQKATPPQTEVPTEEKKVSISELMEKAEKLHLLKEKYEELTRKRKSLDVFAISHDGDNSQIQLSDANGLSFESSNPKCIAQVIDIWKNDFSAAISATENKIRDLMTA